MKDINEYLIKKRIEVLNEIKPICEAFKIIDYDYEIENDHEVLRIYDTRIVCDSNSVYEVVKELVGYLFVQYWKDRYLPFKRQDFNAIKLYWKKWGYE